ncbi:MAG TPA: AAA family ATPase, partial [Ktedonobacterales bacterium]|nr:AAA family ATPase [Ktedonobacterales bacterium]
SVLIEGHNESGKSTLFEAIYFALYGRALVGEDQKAPTLESLLPHGGSRASLQVMIETGATELEITRTLTRGSNGKAQHEAALRIVRPGQPIEIISAVKAVNDCILAEMNGLDSNVLRNSCLMEQQALDRIEMLPRESREMAIAKLLGIEALQRIEQDLKVSRKDSDKLADIKIRLDVARQHQEAQRAGEVVRITESALRAARARASLAARDELTALLQATRSDLDGVEREIGHLRERLQRAATFEALLTRSDENARLLHDAKQQAATLEMMRARQGHTANVEGIMATRERMTALRQLETELAEALQANDAAGKNAHLARAEADVAAAEASEHDQRIQIGELERRSRTAGLLAGSTLLAIGAIIAGSLLPHLLVLLPLALVALLAGIVFAIRWQRLRAAAQSERAKLATLELTTVERRATREAVRRFGIGAGAQVIDGAADAQVEATQQALRDVQGRIRALNIEPDLAALAAERIAAEQALALMTQQAEAASEALVAQQQVAESSRDTCAQAVHELATALTDAGIALPASGFTVESVADIRLAHEMLAQSLHAELARLDAQATLRQQGTLDARAQQLRTLYDRLGTQRDSERQQLVKVLTEQGIPATGSEPIEGLVPLWPALAQDGDPDMLAAALERTIAIEGQLRQQVAILCRQHKLDATTLDADECQKAYDTFDQELRQRRLASEMADEVFKRVVKKVLPQTEIHMRALLPDLTDGRYRDVKLFSDDDNAADMQIQIWDEQAGRFVGKHLFSGGTRDQCSLALRLAFALATLPEELGAMPGFIFLDEPLSSFDDRRSQALVDVLTTGPIARQFPQVFLISHSQSFDPGAFTCSLRMAGGRVAYSTLPDEHQARALWETDSGLTPATN